MTTFRLFLHVLFASVFVGGQILMAGLVPAVRPFGADVPKAMAKRFGLISGAAFVGLLFTGMWNLMEVKMADQTSSYKSEFMIKMLLMLVALIAGAAHSLANMVAKDNPALRKSLLGIGGAVGLVAAVGALYFGIALRS